VATPDAAGQGELFDGSSGGAEHRQARRRQGRSHTRTPSVARSLRLRSTSFLSSCRVQSGNPVEFRGEVNTIAMDLKANSERCTPAARRWPYRRCCREDRRPRYPLKAQIRVEQNTTAFDVWTWLRGRAVKGGGVHGRWRTSRVVADISVDTSAPPTLIFPVERKAGPAVLVPASRFVIPKRTCLSMTCARSTLTSRSGLVAFHSRWHRSAGSRRR